MERNNLDELLRVLELIRAEKYPDIPAEVIREIVNAQYDNQAENDRRHRRLQTTQIVMQFLNSAASKERR